MACLDDNLILAFLEDKLTSGEQREIEQHVDGCERCRLLLSRVAQTLEDEVDTRPESVAEVDSMATTRNDRVSSAPDSGQVVFETGTEVGPYKILRPVGQGGMGRVYLAWDSQLSRNVALKVIHPALMGSEKIIEWFLFEARATARFSHPHIVAIYGVGEHQGWPYVALEYLEGPTLRTLLRQGPLSASKVIDIGLAVADALEEAHRHGLLHRDLKPSNVMIPPDGRIRVLDFGLAKGIDQEQAAEPGSRPSFDSAFTPDTALTLGQSRLGTPGYMSPERWRGEPVGPPADIWALGVMLYKSLCGHHPYAGLEGEILGAAIASIDPVPLESLQQGAPSELATLVESCLAKQASQRPSAAEVAHRLRQLQTNVKRSPRRAPWLLLSVLGVLAAAALVVALLVASRGAPDRARIPPPALAPDAGPVLPVVPNERAQPAVTDSGAVSGVDVREKTARRPRPRKRRASRRRAPGTIVVLSHLDGVPMWADVYLDGKLMGQTPVTLRGIPRGRHRVTLRRETLRPVSKIVDVAPGETTRLRLGLKRK